MKKILIYTLFPVIILLLFISCNETKESVTNKLTIAVSIIPEQTFVKEVAGNLADVFQHGPSRRKSWDLSPTPKDLKKLSNASIYFAIGVPFERGNTFKNKWTK